MSCRRWPIASTPRASRSSTASNDLRHDGRYAIRHSDWRQRRRVVRHSRNALAVLRRAGRRPLPVARRRRLQLQPDRRRWHDADRLPRPTKRARFRNSSWAIPPAAWSDRGGTPFVVDSGRILANNFHFAHLELAGNYGPAHFQTEFLGTALNQMNGPPVFYYGAYIQAGYFLTGEAPATTSRPA